MYLTLEVHFGVSGIEINDRVCVCVCVCVRMRACMNVRLCVCVRVHRDGWVNFTICPSCACVCTEFLTERDQFTDAHACSLLASFPGQAAKKSNITMIRGDREKE